MVPLSENTGPAIQTDSDLPALLDLDRKTCVSRMIMSEQGLSDTRIILVYGPTGSGKTRLSIELAKKLGGEVISADSRQIYRELNIGTGKVTPEEMQNIRHWGLDLIHPDETFNAALFRDYAEQAIADIRSRGKLPIICG